LRTTAVASNPIVLPSWISSTTQRPDAQNSHIAAAKETRDHAGRAAQERGLGQVDLAKKMGVYQSWVTHMESGQRRIDVIELIELGKAIEFDAADMVRKLSRR
jgi:ribosome-binding protein aMBF1 (putative translation factor)